jgi:hypothetical protein
MDIPVSLVANGPLSLPLKEDAPIHIYATISFSLLVKDFDPNTARGPYFEEPRCWLASRLFGPRRRTPSSASFRVALFASSAFTRGVWPQLSALLLGKEVRIPTCTIGSDAKDWEHASASNLFYTFATGATDDDMDCGRAVGLTASPSPDGTGGILFTVKEIDERERAAWKTAGMGLPAPSPGSAIEPGDDPATKSKNHILHTSKAG